MTRDEVLNVLSTSFESLVTGKTSLAKRRDNAPSPAEANFVLMCKGEKARFAQTPDELIELMETIAPLEKWQVAE